MPADTPFERLLTELAETLSLETLAAGEDGVCTLFIDGDITLNLAVEPNGRDLVLFSPLGIIAAANQATTYARLLRANGAGAGRVVLGLAPGSDTALISARRPLEGLSAQKLTDWAGGFVAVARQWRNSLTNLDMHGAFDEGATPPTMNWLQA